MAARRIQQDLAGPAFVEADDRQRKNHPAADSDEDEVEQTQGRR